MHVSLIFVMGERHTAPSVTVGDWSQTQDGSGPAKRTKSMSFKQITSSLICLNAFEVLITLNYISVAAKMDFHDCFIVLCFAVAVAAVCCCCYFNVLKVITALKRVTLFFSLLFIQHNVIASKTSMTT